MFYQCHTIAVYYLLMTKSSSFTLIAAGTWCRYIAYSFRHLHFCLHITKPQL